ncbi:hypothetical protein N657DRAFT_560704 [Parathielavia appendiculata]|uniref:SWIM-type domain-containing protein n=1 Tax=Parathielavia appendiculata TaxID=2587402 RepID=A0AAN6UA98_9PEZI|nr:hypothetical protein N657DRAFT_560704 [Parathielavia appendiculata]
MSLSPTTGMSRLSIECNSAPSRDQGRMQSGRRSSPVPGSEHSSDASDWEAGEESEDEKGENTKLVSSPTGLKYNISRLSPRTRGVVKGLFNQASSNEPPQITLELCGIREEDTEDDGLFYAFQMHEVVPCSVRIGARDSGRFSEPRCECPDAKYRQMRPCKHLIWLFDRLSKHILLDHDPDTELTLTELGYAEELGDPFEQISQIRLDVLADSLRCDTSEPDSDTVSPNPARVREAREMVAAVAGIQPYELDDYRLELETSYDPNVLIRRGDLGATLFSLILASHSLAEWVRSELDPSDPAVNPFRKIQHRVDRIIQELNAYSGAQQDEEAAEVYQRRGKRAEGLRDASWACNQIEHCVTQIEKLISRGSNPLPEWARPSAARALVSILKVVIHNRELYRRLIGDNDGNFVYSALDMLADQTQYIDALEEILDLIGVYGAPSSYVANMRGLVTRMRSHKPTETTGAANESRVPRRETPPLHQPTPGGPQHAESSRSGSGHFLDPGLPASLTSGGRGGGGRGRGNGRGSKRPVPRSSPQDHARGSRKRARGA